MSERKTKYEEMSFIQHLLELRNRLIRAIISILIIFAITFPFSNTIYEFIATPILSVLPDNSGIIAIGVISPFLTPLKMSLIFSVYIAIPYLLYQLWAFVAPALYKHEKRMVMPLVISSTILFYAGLIFSYFVVFPIAFKFLTTIGPSIVNVTPDIQYYLDFVLKVSFAFGVAFEVPIATILLLVTEATTIENLKKQRPYIVVGSFILGMLLTPPDIISQVLIALPMWILFELALFFSRFFTKLKKENEQIKEKAASEENEKNEENEEDSNKNEEDEYQEMTDSEMEAELKRIKKEEKKLK